MTGSNTTALKDGAKAIEELCKDADFAEIQNLATQFEMTELEILRRAEQWLEPDDSVEIRKRIAHLENYN